MPRPKTTRIAFYMSKGKSPEEALQYAEAELKLKSAENKIKLLEQELEAYRLQIENCRCIILRQLAEARQELVKFSSASKTA